MCHLHYVRNRTHGSPHVTAIIFGDPVGSFWSKVDKSGECWTWTANKSPDGYGRFWAGGKLHQAHRISYEWEFGAIAGGMVIDHECHNRSCVRPDHLRQATQKQNMENRAGAEARNKAGIRGVYHHEARNKWDVQVKHHGRNIHVGRFDTSEEAEAAAIAKRNELFTHNAEDRKAS